MVERNITIPSKRKLRPSGDALRALVESSLDDDKAEDIVVIDLTGKTQMADYMVIASGQSSRQVGAMADHLCRKMKDLGVKEVAVEGAGQSDWVLIDAGDVVVHLFRPEVRDFYSLEKLWTVPDVASVTGIGAQPLSGSVA
ncbi:MAG: ribosome silencing factor [Rhodospirillales bacterium]|nr:ribosome silencing factor [Rhodospirillales bacterium]